MVGIGASRRTVGLTEEKRDRLADTLRLSHALGGEAATIPCGDRRVAENIIAYAHASNVTQIVIGKSTRSRWFEIVNGSVVHHRGEPRGRRTTIRRRLYE